MINNNLLDFWKSRENVFPLSFYEERKFQRKSPKEETAWFSDKKSENLTHGFLAVTAKRSLPWNSSFLFHRQIKFTENTVFSQVNACFSLCKPKKQFHQDRSGGSKGEKHWAVFLLLLKNAQVLPLALLSFYRLREADSVIFISWKKENRVGVFSATKFLFAHGQRMPKNVLSILSRVR